MVVCGLPLAGKSPLAARLGEMLPNVVTFEVTDNLANDDQIYRPAWRVRASKYEVEVAALTDAVVALRRSIRPLIIVVARFATAALRQKAATMVGTAGGRFLLVEATSSPIRSLRRISPMTLPAQDLSTRLERYATARETYEPLTAKERAQLPGISLKTVLSDLDVAAERVAGAWLSAR